MVRTSSDRDGFFPNRSMARRLATDLSRREVLIAGGYGAFGLLLGTRSSRAGTSKSQVSGPTAQAPQTPPPVTDSPITGPIQPPSIDRFSGVVFDIVLEGGRVIDPETGFDRVANVGIIGGKVVAVTPEQLTSPTVLPVQSKVVAPGFVDILSYEPNPFGVDLKLLDGVTTNLAMHGVSNYGPDFFAAYEGTTKLHFGGAFHHHFMRGFATKARPDLSLSPTQLDRLETLARQALEDGLAGISFSPEYSPGTTTEELYRLAAVAAEKRHACFFHTRHSAINDLQPAMNGIVEAIDVGRRFGVPIHIEHITSTGGTGQMPQVIDLIEGARSEGLDVSACLYPYDFWGTFLASARFSAGWQQRFGLSYEDLQIAGTSQRLTEDTYDEAQRGNKLVAALGSIPEDDILHALGVPWTMIASDAIANPGLNNHPRCAGTFARTLGRYVQDIEAIDLRSALAKLTILPAQRVATMIPAMQQKGWLREGADADIVVFDPLKINDQASVENPALPSEGIELVLVDGVRVVDQGKLVDHVTPGAALRSG